MINLLCSSIINHEAVHKLIPCRTTCHLTMMERIMRHFSPIANIDGIDLYKVDIEVHLIHPEMHSIHLVHPYLVLYLSQGHFNARRSVLYVEKSAVGQLITPSKRVITQKRSLVRSTPNIRTDRVTNRTYNAGSTSMKVQTMMKA